MSRSALYVVNTSTQTVAIGDSLNLGGVVRKFGCSGSLIGANSVNINEVGYYDVNVSVTLAPIAAGDVTILLLNNGIAVPGATATGTATAAGDIVNLSFASIVRVLCGANAGSLSVALSGADSNVTNVAMTVEKL